MVKRPPRAEPEFDLDVSDPISIGARLSQLASERPDRPAVSDAARTITWRELDRRTNRIARALGAVGVQQGDLVTVGLPNTADFIEACYGAWKVGATPQPISHRLPAAEAKAVMDLAQTPILIAAAGFESDRPRYDIAALLALSDDASAVEDRTAPIWKAPTSGGSTGRPKLILSGGPGVFIETDGGGPYRTSPDDVFIMPGPLYHNGPFTSSFGGLGQGGHLVILPRFDAEETLKAVERHRGTWMYLVPTMMSRIWRLPPEVRGRYDVSSLRTVWHLAAPCPPWLKESWIEWLGAEVIMELYAGTEAQAVTIITGAEWLAHRGSVGQVKFGEMAIFDEAGEPAVAGEVGEIYMRRPKDAPPSYSYRGATPRTRPGGWESLGDIGWFDEQGYLYLADRRADMILVGGSNVYPAEIEAALDEHPLVASSAVIGLPDEDLGNIVHAIVQARPGLSEEDLREHVAGRLVRYKQPRSYEFVAENIRDDAGKVRRSQLRAERVEKARAGPG
jgi:bile acid-coenzyme A ligase